MKNIEYISASAGAGKTTKLTRLLAKAIAQDNIRPENIILTTFTIKAANDFKEKCKEELYKRGKFAEAQQLDQAIIGTIDSVANYYVGKYWHLLGNSPKLEVLSDEQKDLYISQSLADLPNNEQIDQLKEIFDSFTRIMKLNSYLKIDSEGHQTRENIYKKNGFKDHNFWIEDLKRVIEYTGYYFPDVENLTLDVYQESIDESHQAINVLCNGASLNEIIAGEFAHLDVLEQGIVWNIASDLITLKNALANGGLSVSKVNKAISKVRTLGLESDAFDHLNNGELYITETSISGILKRRGVDTEFYNRLLESVEDTEISELIKTIRDTRITMANYNRLLDYLLENQIDAPVYIGLYNGNRIPTPTAYLNSIKADLQAAGITEEYIENLIAPIRQYAHEKVAAAADSDDFLTKTDIINDVGRIEGLWNQRYTCVELKDTCNTYVDLLFSLAVEWHRKYQEFKRQRHLVDFKDMEVFFYRLLSETGGQTEVQSDIRNSIKRVYVDEFQDCSPLQIQIFSKLSDLLTDDAKCYWVGDEKQAIYGFRGTDTELIHHVTNLINGYEQRHERNCHRGEPLTTSRRSVPTIVNAINKIFGGIIEGYEPLEVWDVKSTLERTLRSEAEERGKEYAPLELWIGGERKEEIQILIANQISKLLSSYKPSDIAVLARNNEDLNGVAKQLGLLGIPVNWGENNVNDSCVATLLKALLALIVDSNDALAKAQIVNITVEGKNAGHILSDRISDLNVMVESQEENTPDAEEEGTIEAADLENVEETDDTLSVEGEPEHPEEADQDREIRLTSPLVEKVIAKDNQMRYKCMNVSSVVRSLIVDLNLEKEVQRWRWEDPYKNKALLQFFINLAEKYEEDCSKLSIASTLTGYINCITNYKQTGKSEERLLAGAVKDGVCMSTMHQSKGLQWKVVILYGLEYNPAFRRHLIKRNILGVQKIVSMQADDIIPHAKIRVIPLNNLFAAESSRVPDSYVDAMIPRENQPMQQDYDFGYSEVKRLALDESRRLLYVAMTRPQEKLVMAVYSAISEFVIKMLNDELNEARVKERTEKDILYWFKAIGLSPKQSGNLGLNEHGKVNLFEGLDTEFTKQEMRSDVERYNYPKTYFAPQEGTGEGIINRTLSPSKTNRQLTVGDLVEINFIPENGAPAGFEHLPLRNVDNMAEVGTCIHDILCSLDSHLDGHEAEYVKRLIKEHNQEEHLPEELNASHYIINSWNYLVSYLQTQYGQSVKRSHELAFKHCNAKGQIVTGSMDLVWWLSDTEVVLIDYKSYPGDPTAGQSVEDQCRTGEANIKATGPHYAGNYAGQFNCYQEALGAKGIKVKASLVYYPLTGLIAKFGKIQLAE